MSSSRVIRLATAKVFKLGNSQAVRIPARYRLSAREVEIFERGGELVLRPKARSAADVFAAARALAGGTKGWKRPRQGRNKPIRPLD
jgi:antitoxin VapB